MSNRNLISTAHTDKHAESNVAASDSLIVQRKIGIQQPLFIQTKLEVGSPDDPLEYEADAMADRVMRMPSENFVQRKCAHCEENEKLENIQRKPLPSFIQRKDTAPGAIASESIDNQIQSGSGNGSAMGGDTKSFMESRFGSNFSNIKIHTNHEAIQMTRDLNANAFTVGNDIYFNEGQYQPGSDAGRHLLAHELTHTIQQRGDLQNENRVVQRKPFAPWPGQTGTDVAGTYSSTDGVIKERVQRTGDPRYSTPMPSLLEFNPATCSLKSTLEINFVHETNADNKLTADEFSKLKKRILDIGNERLNGWITIKAGNQAACPDKCKDKDISVTIEAKEGSGQNAATVTLGKSFSRENAGNIGKSSSEWTIWHEMGHIVLGAADEYADPGRPAERVNESDYSIMASSSTYGRFGMLHARHFSHLAAWLTRKFPGCTFDIVESDRPMVVDWTPSFGSGILLGDSEAAFISAGVDMGIPFDKMRRFSLLLGPRLNLTLGSSAEGKIALLTGFRAGLRYQTVGDIGFKASVFAEGGGVGFTDLPAGKFGVSPYVEGGTSLGVKLGPVNFSLEGAIGGRTVDVPGATPGAEPGTEFQRLYRISFFVGGTL